MTDHVFTETDAGLAFVGNFAALYAEQDDPWEQSGATGDMADYYAYSRNMLIEALWRHGAGPQGLEIGCGHGHLTEMLNEAVGPVMGLDISATAVRQATALHPGIRFVQGDVTADDFNACRFGYVIWAQILWYVLHRIDVAIDNTLRAIEPGGLFVVSQAFLREQRYGKDIADGFDGALRLFLSRPGLQLIEARYDVTGRYVHRDGLMVFRRC